MKPDKDKTQKLCLRQQTQICGVNILSGGNRKWQNQGQENFITTYNKMWQSGNCDICANILKLEDFKMDKYIYDENNGLWYERKGDYLT